MVSRLSSTSMKRGQNSPRIQVLLVAFIFLFILFLWLNFVLTQDLETIGREIQVKNGELRSIERQNQALKKEISADSSQERMAAQAMALGYQPQTPVFLTLNEPLVQASGDIPAGGGGATAPLAEGEEWSSEAANALLAVLAGQFGTSEPVRIP